MNSYTNLENKENINYEMNYGGPDFSTTYWNPQYQYQMEQYYGSFGQPLDYGTAYPLSDRDSTSPPNYHQNGYVSNGYQMNGMVEGSDVGVPTDYNNWMTEYTIPPTSLTPPASSTSSSPKLETSPVQIAHRTPLATHTSRTSHSTMPVKIDGRVRVEVTTADEWSKFDPENMEMRATADGRNLFPVIIFKVTGLQPDSFYRATLHLEPVNGCLLRFDRKIKKWVRDPKMKGPGATRTEAVWTKRMTGAEMMETLDWSRVKLFTVGNPKKTNEGKGKKKENKSKYADQMMKVELRYQYVPVLTIMNDDNEMATHQIFTSHYPQCQFIVASIYCTPSVIAMKKESTFSKFKTCKRN